MRQHEGGYHLLRADAEQDDDADHQQDRRGVPPVGTPSTQEAALQNRRVVTQARPMRQLPRLAADIAIMAASRVVNWPSAVSHGLSSLAASLKRR